MSATASSRPDRFGFLLRALDRGLTSLGQVWLDAVRARHSQGGPDWDPRLDDPDEELRLMIALSCAGFH